jgi:hypothetical protein
VLEVKNALRDLSVNVILVDEKCQLVEKGTLAPGEQKDFSAHVGEIWRFQNAKSGALSRSHRVQGSATIELR